MSAPFGAPPHLSPGLLDRLVRVAAVPAWRSLLTVHAPFTGQEIGSVPAGTPEDLAAVFAQARAAQPAWAAVPFAQRAEIFIRFHDLLLKKREEALDLIQWESGKARLHAFEEVADAAIVSRYYAHHAERHLRPRRRAGALPLVTRTLEVRPPLGVVGMIAPWNYPLSMAITDAIPALMAGNAVVLKPAEQTPFTALWAVDLLVEAGLPEDVLRTVPGVGEVLGPALIAESDFIHFTGSTEVGRIVARQCAEQLIGCSLELGGKNPMLVLEDADLAAAVDGAIRGCFSSAGQLCISAERLYVHERVFSDFMERFARRTNALRVGASFDFDMEMGSLVSGEHLRKVQAHVQDALSKGATAVTGGMTRPDLGPFFYAPTILTGVTPAMTLYREETFGPVAAVYPVGSVEEALSLANDSAYGLNASIWTGNEARGLAVAKKLEVGTVNINEAYAATWGSVDAPMGGFKHSGLGRRHGAAGIQKYTELQTIAVQKLLPIAPPPRLGSERYAHLLSQLLSILRRLPGLR